MFLKQQCLAISGFDLNHDISHLSGEEGISNRNLKSLKKQVELLKKDNFTNFSRTCLEIQDFNSTQSKLKLTYIRKLLISLILKLDRWARRANFLNKGYANKCKRSNNATIFKIDTKLILHTWSSLKNLISHHPRVNYDSIHQKAFSLKFLNNEKFDLSQNILGSKPSGKFLLECFKDLKSKSPTKLYF